MTTARLCVVERVLSLAVVENGLSRNVLQDVAVLPNQTLILPNVTTRAVSGTCHSSRTDESMVSSMRSLSTEDSEIRNSVSTPKVDVSKMLTPYQCFHFIPY
jgi:hypothetical protein